MKSTRIYCARIKLCIIILIVSFLSLKGQISPGKLTKYHSALEGISNCTQCHDLGAKVSEQKCLDCHQPLKNKILQNKGFHSSREVKNKKCIACHSEHHGLNFEIVRFDKNNFNHQLTGYELKGAHKTIDCAQCHKPANITDIKLKLNPKTFLGLSPSCVSCHEDYHQNTLDNDCAKCHNTEKFKPATGFNHTKTDFPLTGAHVTVDCIECHKTDTKDGKDFQHFAGVNHKSCQSCHKDPHKGNFGTDCKSCHTTESFSKMKSTSAFNHSLTGFTLEGKHRTIDCKKCHDGRHGTIETYKEFAENKEITCQTCHDDVHESKFGPDCKSCHDQESFSINVVPSFFNHGPTGYPLTGLHLSTDCRKCHNQKYMTAALKHDDCKNCHQDYHMGDFSDIQENDCRYCHTTSGFTESNFDFERHEMTNFPLVGAHQATPCIACHRENKDRWIFRNIGEKCNDCHINIHEGYIPQKYMPENNCTICHNNENWSSIQFNHNLTNFILESRHNKISCASCHFKIKGDISSQRFIQVDQQCFSCHENIHGEQFQVSGVTDCKRCHGFEKWDRSNFNHDNTRFKLEGAHTTVDCKKCHPVEVFEGISRVLYKTNKLDCRDCHM